MSLTLPEKSQKSTTAAVTNYVQKCKWLTGTKGYKNELFLKAAIKADILNKPEFKEVMKKENIKLKEKEIENLKSVHEAEMTALKDQLNDIKNG